VSCYHHRTSSDASFVFVDAGADASRVTELLNSFPGSTLMFASHGKYLLEVPAESRRPSIATSYGAPEFLPFACIKTTQTMQNAPMAAARA
jgi:hypothetical protein